MIEFITALHPDPTSILMFLADKSNMSSIQNFPSMARRTRTLWLLYRSLCVGGAIPRITRNMLYEHIVNSHFHMSKAFMNGGVFPMAVLMPDGVKHTYVFYRKRQTLHEALQPLRLLANEILLSPLDEYSEYAVKRLNEIEVDGDMRERLSRAATLLCLAIPVAYSRPAQVKAIIESVRTKDVPQYIKTMIDESSQVLDRAV